MASSHFAPLTRYTSPVDEATNHEQHDCRSNNDDKVNAHTNCNLLHQAETFVMRFIIILSIGPL